MTTNLDKDEVARRKREEYEMQLFGFHSRSVKSCLLDGISHHTDRELGKLYQTLEKNQHLKDKEESIQLKKTLRSLRNLYKDSVDPHLRKLEDTVDKFISIPNNVLLKEDSCQKTQYTEDEYNAIRSKYSALNERLKRATLLNSALEAEIETLNSLDGIKAEAEKLCREIEEGIKSKPVKKKTLKTIEHLKNLQQLLNNDDQLNSKMMNNREICDEELDFKLNQFE